MLMIILNLAMKISTICKIGCGKISLKTPSFFASALLQGRQSAPTSYVVFEHSTCRGSLQYRTDCLAIITGVSNSVATISLRVTTILANRQYHYEGDDSPKYAIDTQYSKYYSRLVLIYLASTVKIPSIWLARQQSAMR